MRAGREPAWLRALQVTGVVLMVAALSLQFCRLAFGMWQHQLWVDAIVFFSELVFIVSLVLVIRRRRMQQP